MLFRVRREVSRNANADANDAIAVKRALRMLDFYQEPEWGLSPWPDEPMFQGIQRFQIDTGLDPDGVITPGGPTERALDDRFRARYQRLVAESRHPPRRRPKTTEPRRSRSLLANAEAFGAGLALGPTPSHPGEAGKPRRFPLIAQADPLGAGLALGDKAGHPGAAAPPGRPPGTKSGNREIGGWSEESDLLSLPLRSRPERDITRIQIPVGPPGVDIDANINEAARHSFNVFWFRDQVRNKGPWDYKQHGREYQRFGNFNYGATGRALGLPSSILLREAGRAQQEAGTSSPGWGQPGPRLNPWGGTGSFGDDPEDQYWIKEGIKYYEERNLLR